jgi:hypothetical protein
MSDYCTPVAFKKFVERYKTDVNHPIGYLIQIMSEYGFICDMDILFRYAGYDNYPLETRFVTMRYDISNILMKDGIEFKINFKDNKVFLNHIAKKLTEKFPDMVVPKSSPWNKRGKIVLEPESKRVIELSFAETAIDPEYIVEEYEIDINNRG